MTPRTYCTYFDRRYLQRGVAMLRSLLDQGEADEILVLALDETVEGALPLLVPESKIFSVRTLLNEYPDLQRLKAERRDIDFIFTLSAFFVRYARTVALNPMLMYADADLFFFSPSPAFETPGGHVYLVPHRFGHLQRWRRRYGEFNVGWMAFDSSPESHAVLEYWVARCSEWCESRVDNGRYADQGYLGEFADVASGVVPVASVAINMGPWNVAGAKIEHDGGRIMVNGEVLSSFHFHGLKRHGDRYWPKHWPYGAFADSAARHWIYSPYVRKLESVRCELRDLGLEQGRETIRIRDRVIGSLSGGPISSIPE